MNRVPGHQLRHRLGGGWRSLTWTVLDSRKVGRSRNLDGSWSVLLIMMLRGVRRRNRLAMKVRVDNRQDELLVKIDHV